MQSKAWKLLLKNIFKKKKFHKKINFSFQDRKKSSLSTQNMFVYVVESTTNMG